MKFYSRERELELLREAERRSAELAQLTVISGRKRIGKTSLIREAKGDIPTIHFFIGPKNEAVLSEELSRLAHKELGDDFGGMSSLGDTLQVLMETSRERRFTLVIDDFQKLGSANQKRVADIWESRDQGSKMNLIVCGGSHDDAERLFGQTTDCQHIMLEPFGVETIKEILGELNPSYTPEDLLTFCMLTGGVARYVEVLAEERALTSEAMLSVATSRYSFFLSEGQDLLTSEFGKDCNTYFSILSAIADGRVTRSEITSYIRVECGGYLDKLEKNYGIIRRHRPFLQPEGARNVTYGLKDNYLTFWLRYVYKHNSMVEIGDNESLLEMVKSDYDTFARHILERYFRQKLRETEKYDTVSNYWEKGGANAIPVIATNESEKRMLVADCSGTTQALKAKAQNLLAKLPDWECEFRILSRGDM